MSLLPRFVDIARMADPPRVVGNRIQYEGKVYEARPVGGGRFKVVGSGGQEFGHFYIKDRMVHGEDGGVDGAPAMATIGELWAAANLSLKPRAAAPAIATPAPPAPAPAPPPAAAPPPPPAPAPAPAPPPVPAPAPAPAPAAPAAEPVGEEADLQPGRSICRIAVHHEPDQNALNQAKAFHAWLRNQNGVRASYLARDPKSGKTISVTIWENQEKLSAIRYAQPPRGAVQLKSISVELMYILG